MKCANCNRPLSAAAVRVGRLDLGPVCAKRLGLIEPKKRTPRCDAGLPRRSRKADSRQVDWVRELT